MNQPLKTIDYQASSHCRDYLQDAAKVLVEFQQLFIPPEPHYWHVGLEIVGNGLRTQKLIAEGQEQRCVLDFVNANMNLGTKSWQFADYDPNGLKRELQNWLAGKGRKKEIAPIQFSKSSGSFEPTQAAEFSSAFSWARSIFIDLEPSLGTGSLSPVLLYPHHFDVAFSWFPDNKLQYTMGLSTGDETIAEPYFYVTAYPEPNGFTASKLPTSAFWQSIGFSGAILKYNDAVSAEDPSSAVANYMRSALGLD